MRLEIQPQTMILAAAIALAGCGDDGASAETSGSTGGSTAGSTSQVGTSMNPTTVPGSESTSEAETSSSTSGSDSSSSGSTGSTSSAESTTTGSSTGTIETVTLSGVVSDFATPTVLENIEVCVFGEDGIPCTTSDAKGAYSLMGVPVAEGAIEFTGPSRFPSLFWGEGPMEDQTLNYSLLSNIAAAVLAASLGEEIDDGLGHLALAVSDDEGAFLSEVTFTMTPSSGAVGYLTPKGIDPELTETTEAGFAGWLNVDIGEVEIVATHPTLTCVPGPGALVGATPEALRIDITAGYLGSTFPFVCS